MSGPRRDRAVAIFLSVLAHLAVAALFTLSWWHFRPPSPQPQALAIEATVINNAPPATPQPQPEPQPEPQPAQPEPQPQPDPDVAAQRQLEEQHAAEQKAADQKAEEAKVAAEAKAASEKEQRAREAAALKQQQLEAARRKQEEDKRKQDEAKRKQEEARQLAEKQRAERDKAQSEAELRNQMAAEEHLNAVKASGLQAQYLAMIAARVQGAWIRPPSARPGLNCQVLVTQVPGGTVTNVRLGSCNGDDAVRRSIEDAVYKASPLPVPPDPSLFDRDLKFNFVPSD